jgi:glycosyltransferase involved in cell wall biosynthesis
VADLIEKLKAVARTAFARTTGFSLGSASLMKNSEFASMRIMYVANASIPTLQLSFIEPLKPLVEAGEIATDFLTEQQIRELFGKQLGEACARDWVLQRMEKFKPTVIIFCRYSGPHGEAIVKYGRTKGAVTIFHIDDDLLNVPIEIGQKKHQYHNEPARLAAVRYFLAEADLVYCSTERLKRRLESYGFRNQFIAGAIYCSGDVFVSAVERPTCKIGYMGFDHADDFQIALPAVVEVMQSFPHVSFDLFGSIPKPSVLDQFGNRVNVIGPVRDYASFMKKFASLDWDIGICPLADTKFNEVKANTKWVEYTSVGAAVIASRDTVYNDCCANGCGLLVESREHWRAALGALIENKSQRYELVKAAQGRLKREYSRDRLREQILTTLRHAQCGAEVN